MSNTLIYIHGFLSSPASHKAQQTRLYAERHLPELNVLIPDMPNTPAAAHQRLDEIISAELNKKDNQLALIGSSLGGFFCTVFGERYNLPAVLINPAVRPHTFGDAFVGEHRNPYTGVDFTVTPDDLDCLRDLHPETITPSRYWVMVQEGDETLDYRHAMDYYRECRILCEPGGDHSFQGFERHLPEVVAFLRLNS